MCSRSRNTMRALSYTPEVSVHAAVNRPSVVVRPDALIVTPGAPDVVGELEHHRRGEGVPTGQDVSGYTETRRPGTDHRHPPQHRQHPDGERTAELFTQWQRLQVWWRVWWRVCCRTPTVSWNKQTNRQTARGLEATGACWNCFFQ